MPLHECLPLEVFETILHLCVGLTTPVRDLVNLQLVCRSWRDTIANASFLWTTITVAEGLPAFHKALKMANKSLLDITFLDSSREVHQDKFFKLLEERVDQWSSFVVDSKKHGRALDVLRTQKPPSLKKLHVINPADILQMEEIALFGGQPAVGLKDLRLDNIPIQLTSLQLANLKSLHLDGVPSVSAAEIIAIVTQSPTLEILHLARLRGAGLLPEPGAGHSYPSNLSIQLAFLSKLHLSFLPLPFSNLLLSTLAVPQLRHLNVRCKVKEQPAAQFLAVGMLRLLPVLRRIAVISQLYEVVLSSSGFHTICIGELAITIRSPPRFIMGHFHETLDWLSNHLEIDPTNLPFHLKLRNYDPTRVYTECFPQRIRVSKLTFSGFKTFLKHVILSLGRQTTSSPSSPSPNWPLPQVEIIVTSLVLDESTSYFADMIKERRLASQISSVGIDSPLPKRFKEIWLNPNAVGGLDVPPNEKLLSEVARAAGEADVYWQGKKVQTE